MASTAARSSARGKTEWIILPLHAWEWVFGLVARHSRVTDHLAAGLAAHLALDQLNPVIRHPFFYWLTVRLAYRLRAVAPLVDPDRFAHEARWMTQSPTRWF